MNAKANISLKKLVVTEQRFIAHKPQPKDGKGFVKFDFEDNRKDCLNALDKSICWKASLTMKAYNGLGPALNPEKDTLLMDAVVRVQGEFVVDAEVGSVEKLQGLGWYFKALCQQKLFSTLALLLMDTEYAHIPLPKNL